MSATRRGSTLQSDSTQIADALAGTHAVEDGGALGDPFLLGGDFRSVSQTDVAGAFGQDFAKQLFAVEHERWQGPIPSSFGLHFVFVDERTPGNLPPLHAIRQAVQKEWLSERRLKAEEALYGTLRDRYEIVVEAPPADAAPSKVGQ